MLITRNSPSNQQSFRSQNTVIKLSYEMREALYFRNVSVSVKLDSEADVSKYGQIWIIRPHIRPGPDMISGATLIKTFIAVTLIICNMLQPNYRSMCKLYLNYKLYNTLNIKTKALKDHRPPPQWISTAAAIRIRIISEI